MRRWTLILLGTSAVVAAVSLATWRTLLNQVAVSTDANVLFTIPTPTATPFDGVDGGKAAQYRGLYANGYAWAWGKAFK
jgi:hypothetical protein